MGQREGLKQMLNIKQMPNESSPGLSKEVPHLFDIHLTASNQATWSTHLTPPQKGGHVDLRTRPHSPFRVEIYAPVVHFESKTRYCSQIVTDFCRPLRTFRCHPSCRIVPGDPRCH